MTEANAILRGAEYWQRHPGRAALVGDLIVRLRERWEAEKIKAKFWKARHEDFRECIRRGQGQIMSALIRDEGRDKQEYN